jgi:hypothetical protein
MILNNSMRKTYWDKICKGYHKFVLILKQKDWNERRSNSKRYLGPHLNQSLFGSGQNIGKRRINGEALGKASPYLHCQDRREI